MKCISLRQPWAHLLCSGAKPIENRTWGTAYRGPVLIHAGRSVPSPEALSRLFSMPVRLTYGAIVGVAELVDVLHPRSPYRDSYARQPFTEEGFHWWVFERPRFLTTPLPLPGRLGLWDVPDRILPDEVTQCLLNH